MKTYQVIIRRLFLLIPVLLGASMITFTLSHTFFAIIDSIIIEHVATQDRLTSGLSEDENENLNSLLRKLLMSLEDQ